MGEKDQLWKKYKKYRLFLYMEIVMLHLVEEQLMGMLNGKLVLEVLLHILLLKDIKKQSYIRRHGVMETRIMLQAIITLNKMLHI